ncbi:hypothetical protein 2F1_13 [Uncultured Caudovirales phage clone 2F_1]|uniref:Uncharacterized protein n=1 Tax=Uncultured Caudovirales phage clone 2F_1 TaxID=2992576 RepID=A0A2H4J8L7_9CAUD|nr:hypothetical protein [Acinetobacter radioresistens]YP_010092441.1 hypothetical protein KNT73_gp13 [Uncultured Caudovirales phage clone 2F_1]ASN71614.1 hypothetical protein 2F1_13 [Uncultured Caudovirales phage clone 2F_1]RJL74411.1 hypothetical protein D5055_02740 [Acinetobacter radioresistens]
MSKIYIHTELGIEKRCTCCNEYFPFDDEFFYKNGFKHGIQQWTARCKACYVETYRGGFGL